MRIGQAAAVAPAAAEMTGRRLEGAKPGDSFQAEVVASDKETVQLKLADGTVVTARRSDGEGGELPQGEKLIFTVTSRAGGQLTVARDVTGPNAQNADANEILRAFGAARTPENTALLTEMLSGGLTPSKETFNTLSALIERFPGLTPGQAVFMAREGIPVTPENIAQFKAFLEHGNLIGDQLQNILQMLDDEAAQPGGAARPAVLGDAQPGSPVAQAPLGVQVPQPVAQGVAPAAVLESVIVPAAAEAAEVLPSAQAEPQEGAAKAETGRSAPQIQAQVQVQTPEFEQTSARPAPTAQNAGTAQPRGAAAIQTAQAAQIAQVDPSGQSGEARPAVQAGVPAQAGAAVQTETAAQTGATAQVQDAAPVAARVAVPESQAAPQTAQETAGTANAAVRGVPIQETAAEVSQTRADGPNAAAPGRVPDAAPRAAQGPEAQGAAGEARNTDAQVPSEARAAARADAPAPAPAAPVPVEGDVRKLISSLFRKVDMSRADRLPGELNVKTLARELNQAITLLRERAEDLPEGARARLQGAAGELEQSARFLGRLSSFTPVAGLPLQWGSDRTTAELYVFNDSRNGRRIDPQNATVFLSLMTSNAGRVETLVKILGRNVECDFKLETGEAARITSSGMGDLSELLEDQGFHLARTSVREAGGASDLFDVSKARDDNMSKYFFDRTV